MDEKSQVSIGDVWINPEQLPPGRRQKFYDSERRGENKQVVGQDQCFTVDKNGNVIIEGDMLFKPDQLPGDLKQKFEDCERRGKNTYLGGQDQCFTVDERGNIIMGDMRLKPDQLPGDLKQKFEDCKRRGKNKIEWFKANNFWPDYVWRKGGGK